MSTKLDERSLLLMLSSEKDGTRFGSEILAGIRTVRRFFEETRIGRRGELLSIGFHYKSTAAWGGEQIHQSLVRVAVQGPRGAAIPVFCELRVDRAYDDRLRIALERRLLPEIDAALRHDVLGAPVKTDVVLEPYLAAQLIHECIGHTSEADNYLELLATEDQRLGSRLSDAPLNVFDDPTMAGRLGSAPVDDEGTATARKQLVTDGVWTNLLCDERHAARLGLSGGNARRAAGSAKAIPRMAVTFAAPGTAEVDELVSRCEGGYYCLGTFGGISSGPNFVLRPAYALRIANGRVGGDAIRNFDIRGSKRSVLGGISSLGNDLELFDLYFGCDKDGQDQLPITLGAPHMLIRGVDLVPFQPRYRRGHSKNPNSAAGGLQR